MENDLFEQIKLFLPQYLTAQEQRDLFSALSQFPDNFDFYWYGDAPELLLQGDGWRGFVVLDFDTGNRKEVSGIILSNSCDIDPENRRDFPARILFAPLVEVAKYSERLRAIGKKSEQIESVLDALRRQQITSLFYLPECPGSIQESLVPLDDIHSNPVNTFLESKPRRLFRLNQYAFYLLLIKLSIHFCRSGEGVKRFSART